MLLVEPGTYWPISTGNKAIRIESTGGASVTFIDGGFTNRCATLGTLSTHTNTVLEGFTLTTGNAFPAAISQNYGGGAICGTLVNCTLTLNDAVYGGGAYRSTLINCTLVLNYASYGGGAHRCALVNCALTNNDALSNGGGSSYGTLDNCTLTANTAYYGGGAFGGAFGGALDGTLTNCLLWGNEAAGAGGGAHGGTLVNCTLSGNEALSHGGGSSYGTLNNCIVWGNNVISGTYSNHFNSTFNFSCAAPMPVDPYDGGGNIAQNPLFVGGDFRLQPASPCIGKGDDQYATWDFDLDGNPRIHGDAVDMGAYEYTPRPAAIFYVNELRLNDSGDGLSWATAKRTLQAAIDLAVIAGDTVVVTNGTYAPIATANRAITIQSVEGADETFIDGGGTNRCATLGTSSTHTATVLTGFTLMDGDAAHASVTVGQYYGGGSYGGTLNDCWFTDNEAYYGGGAAYGTLSHCTLSGNAAYNSGGGAYHCTLDNCWLLGNNAEFDGGGAAYGTLNDCWFWANWAREYGGGAYEATLNNCTLWRNEAEYGGGAAYGTLSHCTLSGNTAYNSGGGAFDAALNNCLLTDNRAGTWGGGVLSGTLTNCTLAGNSAYSNGGGASGGTLNNCIVWGNTVTSGPYSNYNFSTFNFSCTAPAPVDGYDGGGNIDDDPLFVDAVAGNYRLRSTSPCIDAGSDGHAPWGFDLDGNPRIHGSAVDMGAYEHTPRPATVFYVDWERPDDNGDGRSWATAKQDIQSAIDLAIVAGDTVIVTNGTYWPIVVGNRAITIQSVNGAEHTFINGGGGSRCATLGTDEAHTNTVLSGFTLTGGDPNGEAGLTISINPGCGGGSYGGTLNHCVLTDNAAEWGGGAYGGTLNHCTLTDNWADFGGGAYLSELANCTLTGNEAGGGGGACYGTLTNCTLTRNEAYYGGGATDSELFDCALVGNTAEYGGGAIESELRDCTLTDNMADYGGGADYSTLVNCVLTNNTAAYDGGGANDCGLFECLLSGNWANGYGGGAYEGWLFDCTLTRNEAYYGGGAYQSELVNCTLTHNAAYIGGGSFYGTLDNCVFTGNSARASGGGASNGTLNNCLLTGNTADLSGGGSFAGTLANCTIVGNSAYGSGGARGGTLVNCIVWGNTITSGSNTNHYQATFAFSCTTPMPTGSYDGGGNITLDPLFVNPATGDYHLQPPPGSPCVNAGDNARAAGLRDLDGNHRIWGGRVDMGCYEHGSQPSGVVFHVDRNKSNDNGDGLSWATAKRTLQGAADCATLSGDIVLVTNGTYAAFAVVGESITIQSVNGDAQTFIDGGGIARCATLYSPYGFDGNARLSGFTLLNGLAIDGGGACSGTLTNCTLIGNTALYYGGGAHECTLDNCRLMYNTVLGSDTVEACGGGVYDCTLDNCTLMYNAAYIGGGAYEGTLNNCMLSGNNAGYGGGAYGSTLANCTLSDNRAGYGGGASDGTLNNCLLTGNTAEEAGGGAHGCTLNHCTLTGNAASGIIFPGCGGGSSDGTLNNCLLTGNSAYYGGGSYFGTLANCTLAGNTAAEHSGGSYDGTLNNCIVWGNTAPDGPNHYNSTFTCSCTAPMPVNQYDGGGNITLDPLFVNPATGDYRLQSGSKCIDAGDDGYVTWDLDLDGNLRIWGDRVDMGAYEFGSVPPGDGGDDDDDLTLLLITRITVGDSIPSGPMRWIALDFTYEGTLPPTVHARMWLDLADLGDFSFPPCSLDDHGGGTATLTVILPVAETKAFFRIEAP
ncbi:MAG: hypothetical protein FWG50_05935 [Kiritimatiellaeota bacterium]|nr:hypothetical protein [Kiritimatiellota bacterium]